MSGDLNEKSVLQGEQDLWSARLSRRGVLKVSAAAAGGALLATSPSLARAASTRGAATVKVASLFDATGNLSIYGSQMTAMSKFAVADLNRKGGVLGRQIELKTFDTQSKIELYSRFAQELGADKSIELVVGGITSASREAIRPVFDRFGKLLFYPVIYEGGVCDKLVFVQGSDPQQQQTPLIKWAVQNVGSTFASYTVAADYNYGQIASEWTKILVARAGGKIIDTEFIPLDVSDFSSTIQRIQSAKPKVLVSHLVGANHIAFYRQFAAAGLNKQIQIISPTFGLGNEQQVLTPAEAQGFVVSYAYFTELPTPANKAFVAAFRKAAPGTKSITDLAAQTWNAWHQWALAVNKAGTLDQKKVIAALETGIAFDGPGGRVKVEPRTHHNILDIHLARVNGKRGFTILQSSKGLKPAARVPGAKEVCNLIRNPNTHKQIVPKA